MAEMIQSTGKQGNKPAKKSTRVDLTPMVDLGFLLITFFIFTTTMSEPKAMKLAMPDDSEGSQNEGGEGKTLQLELDGNNTISYYYGNDSLHKQTADYSASGIRKVIQEKQKEITGKHEDVSEMIVLISPKDACTYRNVVDILDEMLINDVKRYMIIQG